MPLKPDQVVTIAYNLTDESGALIDSATHDQPFAFLSGQGQILPRLEEKIGTMLIGGKNKVTLEPVDGYGEYQEAAIQSVPRKEFPGDTEIKEGMSFVANSPDGHQMPFVIKEIAGEEIKIDFNHPLAGKTLNFDLELLDIRDATQEEKSHGHVHGAGGHHH